MNAIEKMWTYINTHDQGEIDRPELYSMWNAVVDHVATEQAALERKLEAAEREIADLKAQRADLLLELKRKNTPDFLSQALNEGDGVYKP